MKCIHKSEKQEVEILKYMGKHSNRWISSGELSSVLGLSRSTINKNIRSIQIKIKNNKNVNLDVVQNKGILLTCSCGSHIAEIIQNIYTESLAYKLITSILDETLISLEKFAYDNYLSVASIRRSIVKINKSLSESGVNIKNSRFSGNEQDIRSFLFKYYWEVHRGKTWPFKHIDREKMVKNSRKVSESFGIWVSPVSSEQIYYLLAISRIRVRKLHFIESKKEFKQLASNNPMFEKYKNIWYESFPNSIYLENELQYYFWIISSFSLNYFKTSLDQLLLFKKNFLTRQIFSYEVTTHLFRVIEEHYGLKDLDKKHPKVFMELLTAHNKAYIVKSDYLITSMENRNYSIEMEKKYPKIFSKIKNILDGLEKNFNQIKHSRNYLMEIYSTFYFELLRNFFLPPVNVWISFSSGRIIEQKILNEITDFFKEKYLIRECDDIKEADLVIADSHGINCKKNIIFLTFDAHLDSVDFLLLDKMIQESISERITKRSLEGY